jgi:predicted secreted protein
MEAVQGAAEEGPEDEPRLSRLQATLKQRALLRSKAEGRRLRRHQLANEDGTEQNKPKKKAAGHWLGGRFCNGFSSVSCVLSCAYCTNSSSSSLSRPV